MANRRLNKKVALIGSAVLAVVVLGVILAILRLGGDPEEFIRDGEAAVKAAREATDEQIKEQNYKTAKRSFQKAYGRAKR